MTIDLSFCKCVLDDGFSKVSEFGIDVGYLFDDGKKVFVFLQKFTAKYGSLPAISTVLTETGVDLALVTTPEQMEYYANKLKRRYRQNILVSGLKDAVNATTEGNGKKALDRIKKIIQDTSIIVSGERYSNPNYVEDVIDRYKKYIEIADNVGKVMGVESPWQELDEKTGGFRHGELWLLLAQTGIGKCVRGDAMVYSYNHGKRISIRDIVAQKGAVCCYDMVNEIVGVSPSAFIDNGKKLCYRVETSSGSTISVTLQHPFLTKDGWKPLSQITLGEQVAGCGFLPEPSQCVDIQSLEIDALAVACSADILVPFSVSDDVCAGGVAFVESTLNSFGTFADNVGFLEKHRLAGRPSIERHIPDSVMQLSNENLAHFIGGVWSINGNVCLSNTWKSGIQIAYSSFSERFVDDLRVALLRFGVVTTKVAETVKMFGYSKYTLVVADASLVDFVTSFNLIGEKSSQLDKWLGMSQAVLPVKSDIVWERIVSIDDDGVHQVFDLSVDDYHNFVAENLVVHNSYLSAIMTAHMWAQGKTVLLVTMENTSEMTKTRLDAIISKFPADDFKKGTLGYYGEQGYLKFLMGLKKKNPMYIEGDGKVATTTDIELLARQYKADIVIVDGLYLLNPTGGSGGAKTYDRVAAIAGDLQKLPHSLGVPVLATSQFNRKLKDGALRASVKQHVGFALELSQNAHGILGLFGNDDLKASNRMVLSIMKNRDGENCDMMLRWDFETMEFHYIGDVDHSDFVPDKSKSVTQRKGKGKGVITF